ncbi:MAG: sulfatase/phosphatase domain-containing protein, partial [bacterium]
DVLATLCDLAEVPAPASSEGKSFAPVLEGEREIVRDVLYGAYCGGTKPGMRCVRRGDWKLIKYDTLGGKVHETQLFDLSRNPSELIEEHHAEAVSALTGNEPQAHQTNLADDLRHAAKLAEMEELLLEEMVRLEDPYRLWNQE